MKIEQFYNKNQFVIFDNKKTTFQSYDSTIAVIDKTKINNDLTLGKDWNYSPTTLKHLYLFLKEYCNPVWCKVEDEPNKKVAIQKLIDNKTIKYNKNL